MNQNDRDVCDFGDAAFIAFGHFGKGVAYSPATYSPNPRKEVAR
jgi:hypothetical protein